MTPEKFIMFQNRLQKVYKHLSKAAQRQHITCYRVYDHDLPEFPFCLELYEDKLYMAEYRRRHGMEDTAHDAWLDESLAVACSVLNVTAENVFVKERKRKEDRQSQYQKTGLEDEYFTVTENGLKFLINLTAFLDTGLFLDHRITRSMVMQEAKDKRILNLFCYTGSFSVYAAAGGAETVTSIDLSNTYIDWARRNMELNALYKPEQHTFTKADVLQAVDGLPKEHYDIIILDPPTFSNSKMMKDIFDVQQHHAGLINRLLLTLRPGGVIYFSNNYTKFVLDAAAITATTIDDITRKTTPFDFEKKLKRWCYRIVK
jgi:23S rRNA (cytosine1962-C5)-methyltransferase